MSRFFFMVSLCFISMAQSIWSEETRSCCKQLKASSETLSDESVFQLDSVWQNQDGQAMHLRDLKGKVTVAAMFYSSCVYICPRIVADVKKIEAQIDPSCQSEIQFVLFSFDSEHDQPSVLKAFAEKRELDSSRWMLLHGDEESVRELAAVLNVRYRKEAEGQFAHASIIHVLDQNGVIVYQQEGLDVDPANTLKAIQKVLKNEK